MMEPYKINIRHAQTAWDWIHKRGGILVWSSVNLSNPGQTWMTPYLDEDRKIYGKPNWQCGNDPRFIRGTDDILVSIDREVKRFHVGVRRSSNGLMLKCTDAASKRIKTEVARAGRGASYQFDYETQDAVIMVPDDEFTLTDWYKYFSKEVEHDGQRVAEV